MKKENNTRYNNKPDEVIKYIFLKTFKSTAKIPSGVISMCTDTLPQMHPSNDMMQDSKYSTQVLLPFMAFELLWYCLSECDWMWKILLPPDDIP